MDPRNARETRYFIAATGRGGQTKTGTPSSGSGGCHAHVPGCASVAAGGLSIAERLSVMAVHLQVQQATESSRFRGIDRARFRISAAWGRAAGADSVRGIRNPEVPLPALCRSIFS